MENMDVSTYSYMHDCILFSLLFIMMLLINRLYWTYLYSCWSYFLFFPYISLLLVFLFVFALVFVFELVECIVVVQILLLYPLSALVYVYWGLFVLCFKFAFFFILLFMLLTAYFWGLLKFRFVELLFLANTCGELSLFKLFLLILVGI